MRSSGDQIYLVVTLALFLALPFVYRAILTRPRFIALAQSGAKGNMNLLTQWRAFLRKHDDPLRRLHIEACLIGHALLAGFLLWALGFPFVLARLQG